MEPTGRDLCTIYRIKVCGWEKQAAIDEMVNGGFGFHPVWKNIIQSLEKLDIEQITKHPADSPSPVESNWS